MFVLSRQTAIWGWLSIVVVVGSVISIPTASVGQEDEMVLIERVESLLRQLQSDQVKDRDAAQQELMEMGPQALDYLDVPDDASTEMRNRIGAVRKALEKKAVTRVSQASRVTLNSKFSVEESLKKIEQQTGNHIVLDDVELLQKEVSLELDNVTFWEAIDQIGGMVGFDVDEYGGVQASLKLAPQPGRLLPDKQRRRIPVDYAKVFQVHITRVDSTINLLHPALDASAIFLRVRWEPRLRPISIDIPLNQVKIIDEDGNPIAVANPDAVVYGSIQPELPQLEFPLPIQRVSRKIEYLQSLTATFNAVLPGRVETFRFRRLGDQRPGRTIEKAGATVTFEGAEQNEDIYMVTVSLSFDEGQNALESHQGWVFENEVYLENEDGKREESIGLETIQQDNAKVTIRYLFLNDPANRTLIYKTPAAIVHLPVEIKLEKIPLP